MLLQRSQPAILAWFVVIGLAVVLNTAGLCFAAYAYSVEKSSSVVGPQRAVIITNVHVACGVYYFLFLAVLYRIQSYIHGDLHVNSGELA